MQFSITQVIAGGFALITATGAAIWTFRGDRIEKLERDVAVYEQSKDWRLPQVLQQIGQATDNLKASLDRNNEFQRLQAERKRLDKDLAEANSKIQVLEQVNSTQKKDYELRLQQLETQFKGAQAKLTSLYPTDESFSLDIGQTEFLAGADVSVGMVDFYGTRNVTVRVLGEAHEGLETGSVVPVALKDQDCKLFISNISYPKASFRFVCRKR